MHKFLPILLIVQYILQMLIYPCTHNSSFYRKLSQLGQKPMASYQQQKPQKKKKKRFTLPPKLQQRLDDDEYIKSTQPQPINQLSSQEVEARKATFAKHEIYRRIVKKSNDPLNLGYDCYKFSQTPSPPVTYADDPSKIKQSLA